MGWHPPSTRDISNKPPLICGNKPRTTAPNPRGAGAGKGEERTLPTTGGEATYEGLASFSPPVQPPTKASSPRGPPGPYSRPCPAQEPRPAETGTPGYKCQGRVPGSRTANAPRRAAATPLIPAVRPIEPATNADTGSPLDRFSLTPACLPVAMVHTPERRTTHAR